MTHDVKAVEVTQADRERALPIYERYGDDRSWWAVKTDRGDHYPLVQAFARHRLDALSSQSPPQDGRAAAVLERVERWLKEDRDADYYGGPRIAPAHLNRAEMEAVAAALAATPPQDGDEVELVARALFENDGVYVGKRWEAMSDKRKEMFRSDARVAISAISALRSGKQ